MNPQSKQLREPFQIIRFSDRREASLNDSICFYEWDYRFKRQLEEDRINNVIMDLKRAGSVIQPDYSIIADEPLIKQKWAVFNKNRVACELQAHNVDVIPNLRWGDERSFEFAFLGIPKHQICAIGTYGQLQNREKRLLFERGLEKALTVTEPKSVLVYGSMPDCIFSPYKNSVNFYQYDTWRGSVDKKVG